MKKILVIFASIISCIIIGFLYFRLSKHQTQEKIYQPFLVVGINAEYPPFAFRENDNIVGFDIDIIQEICKRLGFTMQLKDMSFDILVPEAQRGSIDLIASGVTPTPERSRELLFTDFYFTGDPLVIVSPFQKPLRTIQELVGAFVVVNDGYTADLYMSDIPNVTLRRLPNPAGAFLALESGRADAYVTAQSTVSSFLKNNEHKKFSIIALPETEEKYAFALSPQKADVLGKINSVIADLKKEGLLQTLKVKWRLSHD